MAINVYFVRHGQTYLNLYNRMQGWADGPLTPKGEEDAKRVGRALAPIQFDYVFCSDLARTASTTRFLLAEHPGNNPKPIPEPAFRLATLKEKMANISLTFLVGQRVITVLQKWLPVGDQTN